jgi:hypothetical protein
LDWIGTTEELQTITVLLISYRLAQNYSSSLPTFNRMVRKAGLTRKGLSALNLSELRTASLLFAIQRSPIRAVLSDCDPSCSFYHVVESKHAASSHFGLSLPRGYRPTLSIHEQGSIKISVLVQHIRQHGEFDQSNGPKSCQGWLRFNLRVLAVSSS